MLSFVEIHCSSSVVSPARILCLCFLFLFVVFQQKNMLQKLRSFCCRNAVSSALFCTFLLQYYDCKRRTEVLVLFSCFQRTCRLWKYLFLLLYMWQQTLARLPLSLLRLVWLNFCLPFSAPCSQGFFAFSLSRAKEVFHASFSPENLWFSSKLGRTSGSLWKTRLFIFGSWKGDNGFENIWKWHCRKKILQLLYYSLATAVT